MTEQKKKEFCDILNSELLRYWQENIINKELQGITIIKHQSQRLKIDNIDDIICSICCPYEKQEDLPTIYGKGKCFIKTPSGEGCVSRNIRFSINHLKYERVFVNDTIQINITDLSLEIV